MDGATIVGAARHSRRGRYRPTGRDSAGGRARHPHATPHAVWRGKQQHLPRLPLLKDLVLARHLLIGMPRRDAGGRLVAEVYAAGTRRHHQSR
jgi:hypothetical protein